MAPEIEARKAAELSSIVEANSPRPVGRPAKPEASRLEKAQAIGVGKATLVRAEQHVARLRMPATDEDAGNA